MCTTSGWVYKAICINPFVLDAVAGSRAGSDLKPLPADDRLKAEARFVFRPDLDFLFGFLALQVRDIFAEFFLNASCSSSVAARLC